MTVKIIGSVSGVGVDTDSNNNVFITKGLPEQNGIGGWYTAGGGLIGSSVNITLSGLTLLALSLNPLLQSSRTVYITKIVISLAVSTVGTSGLVPGTLGWQRFYNGPTTGTTTPAAEIDELKASDSELTIREGSPTLTMTNTIFGAVVSTFIVPLEITSGTHWVEWVFEPQVPLVFTGRYGLCLRSQTAFPATQTWEYTYTIDWYEK